MPPLPRNPRNKGLPARWRLKYKTYYYRVPPGQEAAWDGKTEFRLGNTLREAHEVFASRLPRDTGLVTISDLADRYEVRELPRKSAWTRKSNLKCMVYIRKVLGNMRIDLVEPSDVNDFMELVASQKSEKIANLSIELLSHMFTKSIKWGARGDHPITGKKVEKFSRESRDRYVEDWEISAFLEVANPFLRSYVGLKLLLGLDKADMLSIRLSGIQENGLLVEKRRKTRKLKGKRRRFFPFTYPDGGSTGVKEALDAILAVRPEFDTPMLFCTRDGVPYINDDGETSGFNSVWQRAMKKALKADGGLVERFTEHDLRAKVGSDQETDEDARVLLDHSNQSQTRNAYRRRPVVVYPSAAVVRERGGT